MGAVRRSRGSVVVVVLLVTVVALLALDLVLVYNALSDLLHFMIGALSFFMMG